MFQGYLALVTFDAEDVFEFGDCLVIVLAHCDQMAFVVVAYELEIAILTSDDLFLLLEEEVLGFSLCLFFCSHIGGVLKRVSMADHPLHNSGVFFQHGWRVLTGEDLNDLVLCMIVCFILL
jgi:hypothetical protein